MSSTNAANHGVLVTGAYSIDIRSSLRVDKERALVPPAKAVGVPLGRHDWLKILTLTCTISGYSAELAWVQMNSS